MPSTFLDDQMNLVLDNRLYMQDVRRNSFLHLPIVLGDPKDNGSDTNQYNPVPNGPLGTKKCVNHGPCCVRSKDVPLPV